MHTATEPSILVYCQNRAFCKRLITIGAAIAKREHGRAAFLFIQPQELVSQTVANDIETVYTIAAHEKADITILFSDDPLLTLAVHVRQIKATQLVLDERDIVGTNAVPLLRSLLPDVVITLLQKDGRSVTGPPTTPTTAQIRRQHQAPVP